MAEFDNGVIHRFECAKCEMEGVGSSFDSLDELQNHFVLCTSETMKRCPFCSHFIDKDNLVDHIERRHPENDFDYEDQEHSMVFPSKHRKPVIKSGGYETEYQSTSKEADEIKQRMGSRGDKMKENAGTDQDKADLNRIKKEGIEFTDQILSGQLLKNNIMCNGQKIPMMTAILKCIIETKKVDVTRKLKGLKVNKWNKERQKLLLSDVGVWYINSVFLSNLSNCARPNIISQYFACLPPSLEHYLNVPANSLN